MHVSGRLQLTALRLISTALACTSFCGKAFGGFRTPGDTVTDYLSHPYYTFPAAPFTIEGWWSFDSFQPGDTIMQWSPRYNFNDNCLLITSQYLGTLVPPNTCIHIAIQVDSTTYLADVNAGLYRHVTHGYLNGIRNQLIIGQVGAFGMCSGYTDGNLLLFNDQDNRGVVNDARNSPTGEIYSLRVHTRALNDSDLLSIFQGTDNFESSTIWSSWTFDGCPSRGSTYQDYGTSLQHLYRTGGSCVTNSCSSRRLGMYVQRAVDVRQTEPVNDGEPRTFLNWTSRTRWAVGSTYHVNPFRFSRLELDNGTAISSSQYQLSIHNPPPGLFFDSGNAAMVYAPQVLLGRIWQSEIRIAEPGLLGYAVAGAMAFEVLFDDVNNASAVGPGGRPCQNGGQKIDGVPDGTREFDGHYECNCDDTGFTGSNCDVNDRLTLAFVGNVTQQPELTAVSWNERTRWAVNVSYLIQPVNLLSFNVSLSDGTAVSPEDLRFSMRSAPPGLLIDPTTGFAQLTPRAITESPITTSVVASYSSGERRYSSVITNMSFDIRVNDVNNNSALGPNGQPCVHGAPVDGTPDGVSEFDGSYACSCESGWSGANCDIPIAPPVLHIDGVRQVIPLGSSLIWEESVEAGIGASAQVVKYSRHNRTLWALENSYRIAPVNYTRCVTSTVNFSWSDPIQVRDATPVTPSFELVPLLKGFFLDSNTGELIGQPEALGATISTLYAVYPNAQRAPVATINFTVRHADTALPTNGPNGRDCSNSVQRVDAVPFDNSFTCSCTLTSTTAFGDNCELELAAATAGSEDSAYAFGLGGMAGFIVIVLSVWQYRRYKNKYRPQNLSSLQADILESLGVGVTLNIDVTTEFGVLLTLPNAQSIFKSCNAQDLVNTVRHHLPSVLSQKALSKFSLASDNCRIDVNDSDGQILIVFELPTTDGTFNTDGFVAAMNKMASHGSLALGSGLVIGDVSAAVPQCIPREVNRSAIVRLMPLGEGHFAEVIKVEVQESSRSIPYPAAAKILKSGGATGRDELFKEAALMSLLKHQNIVPLLGVVTVPRTMPPLLLLGFCEHGSLELFVKTATNLDTAMLLTFCADVASGLSYLSSRRIVHRDVAARNILVDSRLTCMVSDFGMSTALVPDQGLEDYSRNYVRSDTDELPVRWSSIEILQEGKFSRASDVWAFGCLIYEVMTRGKLPYCDIVTLMEVSEYIKSGNVIPCPEECSERIYAEVMRPCWNCNPGIRPRFSDLRSRLLGLGAIQNRDDARKVQKSTSVTTKHNGLSLGPAAARLLLGPSVYHISAVLLPSVLQAVQPPWKDRKGRRVDPPESATISHAVQSVAKPTGVNVKCPRDGQLGCAYVDTLRDTTNVGQSNALLSYTWGYKLASVAKALTRWVIKTEQDPKSTYIWICSLCLNQHRMATIKTPEELAAEFGERVQAIGHLLPMLEPWRDAEYVTRAWCLFELYTAVGEKGTVGIDIILTEEEEISFITAMSSEGYSCIDDAIKGVKAENATATQEADLTAIFQYVKSRPGGFDTLNSTVREYLCHWFEELGAIKSAHRITTLASDAKLPARLTSSGGVERTASLQHLSSSIESIAKQNARTSSAAEDVVKTRRNKNADVIHENAEHDLSTAFPLGSRCHLKSRGYGAIRFVGKVGDRGWRIGVELDQNTGLNNGMAFGTEYFKCDPGHGVFAAPSAVTIVEEDGDVTFGFDD